MGKLFLLFVLVPILDLWLLLRIGRMIGFWPTVGLVLAVGAAGAWLARTEGLRVIRAWQLAVAQGRMPDEGVLSGILVLVGAALLVTPGVLTDVLGLALLFPPTRRLATAWLRRWVRRKVEEGHVRVMTTYGTPEEPPDVIDVTPRRPDGLGPRD